MENKIFEELDVIAFQQESDGCLFLQEQKKVIVEISLKIIVNETEVASLLCLNAEHEMLAVGFLFGEGVIDSFEDIEEMEYVERMQAVVIRLKEHILLHTQTSLRSVTTGCGKCVTYINPQKQSRFSRLEVAQTVSAEAILRKMKSFLHQSEIFTRIGGVHSVLFSSPDVEVLCEDIGRHNCFDKIGGILLKENKIDTARSGVLYVSGRVSSEIITKVIRMGVPLVVSRSTPTTSGVKLAKEYHITLLGYVRENRGLIYSCPERITP